MKESPKVVAARMLREYGERKFAADMAEYHVSSAANPEERRLYTEVKAVLLSNEHLADPGPPPPGRGGARPGAGRKRIEDERRKTPATLRLTASEWRKVRELVSRLRAGK